MTKQATLGPIDPSINTPLNPQFPPTNPQYNYPVSVEAVKAVKGYIAFAKEELETKDESSLANIILNLSEKVHPLVLGEVYRLKSQIKMLAEKLLINQVTDQTKIPQIIDFLCSDSGSHDYTINRREARDVLGLNVKIPNDKMYDIIKMIFDDISKELGLGLPYDLSELSQHNSGDFNGKMAIIESATGGTSYFLSRSKITKFDLPIQQDTPDPQLPLVQKVYHVEQLFKGWKNETSENFTTPIS